MYMGVERQDVHGNNNIKSTMLLANMREMYKDRKELLKVVSFIS